jgi:hypothetical protein
VLALDIGNGGRLLERVDVPITTELFKGIDPLASCVVRIIESVYEPVGPAMDVVFDAGNGGEIDTVLDTPMLVDEIVSLLWDPDWVVAPLGTPVEPTLYVAFETGNGGAVREIVEVAADVSLATVGLVEDDVSLPLREVICPVGPLNTPLGPMLDVEFVIGNGARVSEGDPEGEILPPIVVNEPGYCDVPLPVGIGKLPDAPELGDVGFGKAVEFDKRKGCVSDWLSDGDAVTMLVDVDSLAEIVKTPPDGLPADWVGPEGDDELLAGEGSRLEGIKVVTVTNGPLVVLLGELSAELPAETMLLVDMPDRPLVCAVGPPGSVELESGYGAVVTRPPLKEDVGPVPGSALVAEIGPEALGELDIPLWLGINVIETAEGPVVTALGPADTVEFRIGNGGTDADDSVGMEEPVVELDPGMGLLAVWLGNPVGLGNVELGREDDGPGVSVAELLAVGSRLVVPSILVEPLEVTVEFCNGKGADRDTGRDEIMSLPVPMFVLETLLDPVAGPLGKPLEFEIVKAGFSVVEDRFIGPGPVGTLSVGRMVGPTVGPVLFVIGNGAEKLALGDSEKFGIPVSVAETGPVGPTNDRLEFVMGKGAVSGLVAEEASDPVDCSEVLPLGLLVGLSVVAKLTDPDGVGVAEGYPLLETDEAAVPVGNVVRFVAGNGGDDSAVVLIGLLKPLLVAEDEAFDSTVGIDTVELVDNVTGVRGLKVPVLDPGRLEGLVSVPGPPVPVPRGVLGPPAPLVELVMGNGGREFEAVSDIVVVDST